MNKSFYSRLISAARDARLERTPEAADPYRELNEALRGNMRTIPFIVCTFMLASPAFAHIGHVGELAGHGHIIAIGATIAAAILAGLVAKGAKESAKTEPEAEEAQANEDLEPAIDPA